jgi:hypothetical protein
MLQGKNYYPPYSGHGTTARHNREFSVAELRDLLDGCGFQVNSIDTVRDAAYDHPPLWDKTVRILNKLGIWRQRLDVIHTVSQRGEAARFWYPQEMYYDLQGYRRVLLPFVRMGMNDHLQIDHSGFYSIENWPPRVRWTKRAARLFLLGAGQSSLALRFFTGERSGRAVGSISVQGDPVAVFDEPPGTWYENRLPLPAPVAGEVEVCIQVNEPWTPQRSGKGRDNRELGVAVECVELC